jgi:Zn-dependent M28 family amino/carboxypeptidase
MNKSGFWCLWLAFVFLFSCGNSAKQQPTAASNVTTVSAFPYFNGDSALAYAAVQVGFGPRVPNTAAHKACGDWMMAKLAGYGGKLSVQEFDAVGYDNTVYKARNIIASFGTDKADRILLMAHWDTRHVADYDPDEAKRNMPIDGANDGASGVAVLIELARLMHERAPAIGVDIVLFDVEDQGMPQDAENLSGNPDTWCLGSQYWARNAVSTNYKARYGILLDMVGSPKAEFPMEEYSMTYAPDVVEKVWAKAGELGIGQYFVYRRSGAVTDDHYYVNKIAGIPSIDIIHYSEANRKGFPDEWHTHADNMSALSAQTLRAVGMLLTAVVYQPLVW